MRLRRRVDHSAGDDFRVVQLTPPGSACSITIGKGLSKTAPGTLQGLQLVRRATSCRRAPSSSARGVDVSPVRHRRDGEWLDGKGGPWNSFMFFNDPDGNGWAIQEKPAAT